MENTENKQTPESVPCPMTEVSETSGEQPAAPLLKKKVPLYDQKEEGKCRNCDQPLDTNFCPNCGQTADIKRLTFTTWMQNIFDAFLNFDGTLVRTFWMLFVRPGRMIKEYIIGQRKDYRNPFTLLVILCTIYGIILFSGSLFQTSEDGKNIQLADWNDMREELQKDLREDLSNLTDILPKPSQTVENPDSNRKAVRPELSESLYKENAREVSKANKKKEKQEKKEKSPWLRAFGKLVETMKDSLIARCILMIPFFAFFTKILFGKRTHKLYNYTELVFATAYITCQKVTIDILLLPWEEYLSYDTDMLTVLSYIFFPAWVYKGLFETKWWKAICKSILIYILSFVTAIVCLILVVLPILYFNGALGSMFS